MMSADLDGVFDPDVVLDSVFPVIEIMGLKLKYRLLSMSLKKDDAIYYIELVDPIDLEQIVGRDWSDIKVGSSTIEKGDIIKLKISPKALKLRFRRHTYGQG